MYKDYANHFIGNEKPVSGSMYRSIFCSDFNLGFGSHRSDTCGREPITGVWGRNLVRRSGASPPEAKSSSAFESLAAEQNVPDSGYVAVHTGVNQKAFCNQASD